MRSKVVLLVCVSQQCNTKSHFPSERLLDTSANCKLKELLVCPQIPIVMKKRTILCIFVILLVARRWQKKHLSSKETYELKKMLFSWISAEDSHPLPAASSEDFESVQLYKSFI